MRNMPDLHANQRLSLVHKLLVALCFLLFVGCGSGSDEEVTRVRFLANDIEIGESVRVEIDFEVESDFFGDVESTTIVVVISRFLAYDSGTAQISDGPFDEDDIRDGDITECDDGRTIVRFSFDRDDLRDREISFEEYSMRFNVVGVESTSKATVQAASGSDFPASCDADFNAQSTDGVEVL